MRLLKKLMPFEALAYALTFDKPEIRRRINSVAGGI